MVKVGGQHNDNSNKIMPLIHQWVIPAGLLATPSLSHTFMRLSRVAIGDYLHYCDSNYKSGYISF